MAFRLVTGRAGHDHVTSDDMGQLFARTKGDGRYRLDEIECSVLDSNTVHVSGGSLLIDGRHFRNTSEGTNLSISNGTPGLNRVDLIVARYTYVVSGNSYTENGELVVIQGIAVPGEPTVPEHVSGSILNRDIVVDIPLFTIPISGTTVGTPSEIMLDEYELPVKYGGTGVAVEILTSVRGAVQDAVAAAAAANSAAAKSLSIAHEAATLQALESLAIQVAAYHGGYIVVGETIVVPSVKGSYSGEQVTFDSASFNEETGVITLE